MRRVQTADAKCHHQVVKESALNILPGLGPEWRSHSSLTPRSREISLWNEDEMEGATWRQRGKPGEQSNSPEEVKKA